MSHDTQQDSVNSPLQDGLVPFEGGVEPTLSFNGGVTISISRTENDLNGKLLVIFAKPGSITCERLMGCTTQVDLIALAEMEGISVEEPALLAITDENKNARTTYLTKAPDANFRDFAIWVGSVTETISYLKVRRIALYLAKESLSLVDICDLTSQFVRALVDIKAVDEVSLFVGRHDYNHTLSLALTLKAELSSADMPVTVLH